MTTTPTGTWREGIEDQRRRLAMMARDSGHTWDLSASDQEACLSGADAIALIEKLMGLADFREDEPSADHQAVYAAMRELLFRGQR